MEKITHLFFIASALTCLTACNIFPVPRGRLVGVFTSPVTTDATVATPTLVTPVTSAPSAPVVEPGSFMGSPLLDAQEQDMLAMINRHRADHGLRPLRISRSLVASSRWMSQDMAARNYFGHTDSLGRSCFRRMDDFDYQGELTRGENIACGNGAAAATYRQWLYSPGHNANMLGQQYNLIGIARAYGGYSTYGWYWTTDFGRTAD